MAAKALPSPDELRKLLDYDPETGILTWRERPVEMFKEGPRQVNAAAAWNARYAGRSAGGVDGNGYLMVSIFDRRHQASRVAWALHYGHWPSGNIDHESGDPLDNAMRNLRDVSQADNLRNRRINRNNASGATGVSWSLGQAKWRAEISVSGRTVHLGMFIDFGAAVAARKAAEREFGYHHNHGRSA